MERNLGQLNLTLVLTRLTMNRVLRRKSTWFLLAVGLLPCLVIGFWILNNLIPEIDVPYKPYHMYNEVQSLYLHIFYIPLVTIFLGLGTINDEIESKNLTFTMVRPLSRTTIAVGRFMGHLAAAIALVVISLMATYFSNMLFQVESILGKLPNLANAIFICSCATAAYLGVVAALGTWFKKFAIMGSIIWMGLDTAFSLLPVNSLKAASIKYKLLAGYWETLPQNLFTGTPIQTSSAAYNGFICLLVGAIGCALISYRLYANEIILSDNSE